MKSWLKKITGIEKLEQARDKAREEADEALLIAKEANEEARRKLEEVELARLTLKERATKKGEPWVNVLDVKVNKENVRNGFFELDWNSFFIDDLIANGYGTEADPEEEIVDRWFRDIVYQMLVDEGLDTQRGSGYINVVPISKGKSEVS